MLQGIPISTRIFSRRTLKIINCCRPVINFPGYSRGLRNENSCRQQSDKTFIVILRMLDHVPSSLAEFRSWFSGEGIRSIDIPPKPPLVRELEVVSLKESTFACEWSVKAPVGVLLAVQVILGFVTNRGLSLSSSVRLCVLAEKRLYQSNVPHAYVYLF